MRYFDSSFSDFCKKIVSKQLIIFGAVNNFDYYNLLFPELSTIIDNYCVCIVDNDKAKCNVECKCGSVNKTIKSVDYIKKLESECASDIVVLIMSALCYHMDIIDQLNSMDISADCYSLPLMTYRNGSSNDEVAEKFFRNIDTISIPKTIHCLWFSEDEKPKLFERCIESWRKTNPEFEIVEWNSANYDFSKNRYLKEAYDNHKWAFASDYARLDIIYNYGGVYLDMDVELTSDISNLLKAKCFVCRQQDGLIEPGSGFGAVKGNDFVGELLHSYDDRRLIQKDGSIDMTPLPQWLGPIYKKYGIDNSHDSQIVNDVLVLSNDYISCNDELNNQNGKLGVHWHKASWLSDEERKKLIANRKAKEEVERLFGKKK